MKSDLKERIQSKFNNGLAELSQSYDYASAGEIDKQQEKLHSSVESVFCAVEWVVNNAANKLAYKIERTSPRSPDIGKLRSTRDRMFFYNVLDIAKKTEKFSVNIDKIKNGKQSLRNPSLHEGAIPFHGALIEVIKEIRGFILHFYPDLILEDLPEIKKKSEIPPSAAAQQFITTGDILNKERSIIVLVQHVDNINDDCLKLLLSLNVKLILDLNPSSNQTGFYGRMKSYCEKKNKVHLITAEQKPVVSAYSSLYWILVRGMIERPSTMYDDLKIWRRQNKALVAQIISGFSLEYPPPTTTLIIGESEFSADMCELIDSVYQDGNIFVFISKESTSLNLLADQYSANIISADITTLLPEIKKFASLLDLEPTIQTAVELPAKDKGEAIITVEELNMYEEDFEVIYKRIVKQTNIHQERYDFYKGGEINWYGLSRKYDVEREICKDLQKQIDFDANKRENTLILLPYPPGLGGTTILKRLAWDNHFLLPTIVLKRYSSKVTANKIKQINLITTLPVLVFVESTTVIMDDVVRLFHEVRAMTFPAVFVVAQRTVHTGKLFRGSFMTEYPLGKALTDDECKLFIDSYKEIAPIQTHNNLDEIYVSKIIEQKNPFFIGLSAFESDFDGLTPYVKKCLVESTELQKKIVVFIAMIHFYAGQEISGQVFCKLLSLPMNRIVNLEEHLSPCIKHLLLCRKNNEGKHLWRTLHQLVAREVLVQVLSGMQEDVRIWNQNLSDYAIEFIDICRAASANPAEYILGLMQRLFILKDDEELVDVSTEGSIFSRLVEEMMPEGRLPVFKALVDSFPLEAHFWAHLGRYYYKQEKDHERALDHVEKAILLSQQDDPLLFHMKGMCLYTKIKKCLANFTGDKNCPDEIVAEVLQDLELAGNAFEDCRRIKNNEYGYVPHITIIVAVIDFLFSISKYTSMVEYLNAMESFQPRKLLDLAETLMEALRRIYDGDDTVRRKSVFFITKCDEKLQEIYGNYKQIISGWNNLLNKNVFKPEVRRQIVRAYVRRSGGFNQLEPRIINTILEHMEANMLEDPKNDRNIYYWFQAAKHNQYIDIDTAISKISRWHSNTDSAESLYYLYILHVIKSIGGSFESKAIADGLIRKSSDKNRNVGNRNVPLEWYGKGRGLKKIVCLKDLGEKDPKFHTYQNSNLLERLDGHISKIEHPGKGEIELISGFKAFFTPAHGRMGKGYNIGSDINRKVSFCLAFSYDGLRAYMVDDVLP